MSEIDCIRVDFKDGTSLLLDPMKLRHVSEGSLKRLTEAFVPVAEELARAEEAASQQQGGGELGIAVHETVSTKDRVGG